MSISVQGSSGERMQARVLRFADASIAANAAEDVVEVSIGAGAVTAEQVSVDSTTLVGTGTDVQAVLEELDNAAATNLTAITDHLVDSSAAHAASAISVLDSGSLLTATDVEAALAEIAGGSAGLIKYYLISFVETAGAGTYTATLAVPDGSYIVHVSHRTSAAWAADTTTADIGYTGALTAYGNDVDIDGVGADTYLPLDSSAPQALTTENVIVAVTTTGAGGTTGRSQFLVGVVIPTSASAPVKA